MRTKNQKGFIQIPLLIAIIAGVLVLGSVGYFGVKKYKNYLNIKPKNDNNQSTTTPELSEVEKLRQEVEELKKQSLQNQNKASATIKDIAAISTGKKSVLTNAQIISKIKPAIVYIKTQTTIGSGMIFSSDGYVLTNAHVVKGFVGVDVSLSTGTTISGNVVGRNEIIDLAVIKLDTTKQLPKVEFGDSDKVQQGDNVFTFGFPFGIEGDVSFKEGTISRRIEGYFETSAEIHPGNSGGPLVDRYGQVIGINTAIFGKSVSGIQLGETIKLAIPINIARDLVNDLKLGKNVLPPKPPSFDEFARFEKDRRLALDMHTTASNLYDDADVLAIKEQWSATDEKIGQAIEMLYSSIADIKSLTTPPVSFSQTISDLLSLETQLFYKDVIIYKLQRYKYSIMSKHVNNIDEQISKITETISITKSINNLYDERYEFFTSTYFPKLGEYVTAAKPYLDIIYPKD